MKPQQDTSQEPASPVTTPAQRIRADWKRLMQKISYQGILTNIPYIAFCALLCILYIANGHRAVATQRAINKATDELKELRWQNMDAKTRLMNAGTESDIIRSAAPMGLKPLTLPAYAIEVDTAKH